MSGSASRRIPANQVGLVFVLLLAIWLGFQYWPRRKEPTPPLAPMMAESRLRAVGLADNPDWEGLPEFFAIVEKRAEWKDGRTHFAFWHPVMKTYSYYFEATRDGSGFRFKEIAEPHDPDVVLEGPAEADPIRFYYRDGDRSGPLMPERMSGEPAGVGSSPKVKLDVPAPKILPTEGNTFPAKPQKSP